MSNQINFQITIFFCFIARYIHIHFYTLLILGNKSNIHEILVRANPHLQKCITFINVLLHIKYFCWSP